VQSSVSHIQPERYAQYLLKINKKELTLIKFYIIIIVKFGGKYMKLIASGATADVFLNDDDILIKLFKANFSKERVEFEANNQKSIFELGIPVPEIYDILKLDGRYGIVMEYVKGISLGEKLQKINSIDEIKYFFNHVIDLQIGVNSISLKTYPRMENKLTEQINAAKYLDNNQKKVFLDKLGKIEFKNNLCHGDFHPYNLLDTDDGIKIIDWADSTMGNMEADIYRSYLMYWINFPEIGNEYLKIYCSKTKVEKDKILDYEPIIMAARLSENVSENENHCCPV
jgi:tRNA A-37 threonylcarbamoyl transferase component Bud32